MSPGARAVAELGAAYEMTRGQERGEHGVARERADRSAVEIERDRRAILLGEADELALWHALTVSAAVSF